MKKKVLMAILMMALLVCLFAIAASAATIYKDADGDELFQYEMDSSNIITSYEGEFAKTDSEGNEITWYVVSTGADSDGNTVKTVAFVKTMDAEYFTLDGGVYSYGGTSGKPVTQYNVVSVCFPKDAGIERLNLENGGYKAGGYSYSPFTTELLFVYLPNTLTELPERIIQNSKALVCDIPSDTPFTSISRVAFYHAKCLRAINIPSAVEVILSVDSKEGTAFYQCVSLESVTFGENSVLKEIQNQAFLGCNAIKELTLPDSLEVIGQEVFAGSSLVESPFTKNSQCKSIGKNCFSGIKTLKSMIIPAAIEELYVLDFMPYCENIEWIGFGNGSQLRVIKSNCFNGASVSHGKWYSKLQIETLPDTVEIVEDYAFIGTGIVESPFTVNSQCTFIGHQAFSSCSQLKEINIPKNATFVTDLSGYRADNQKNGVFCGCSALETVNFHPETAVEVLPSYMFAYCSSIKEIKIPNSVTTLSARMFDRCVSLETLVLGANVRSLNNGREWSDSHNSLTYGCVSLKYVYLPAALDLSTGHKNACHVFSTFDYSGTFEKITFFVNGTEDEAKAIQDGFKAVTSCNRNDRITNARIISLEEYEALEEIGENYIVYSVNTCSAFYDGEHTKGSEECTRCGEAIYCADVTHNLEINIVYVDYLLSGVKTVKCLDCNSKAIEEETSPLFVCLGYSAPKWGDAAITVGFNPDEEAIAEYQSVTGKAVNYGAFAVSQRVIGENDIVNQDGAVCPGAVMAEVASFGNDVFELKITGIASEHKASKLAIGAFVAITEDGKTEYFYLQASEAAEGEKYSFVSYNDVIELVAG